MNFGTFQFRPGDRTLWRDSERVHLTAKARDLLACLVAAPGRFVSKAEIMNAVWPDIHVLPDNIKVLIHEIRTVLDEDARHPHFIRSEAGLGYAFVPDGPAVEPAPAADRSHGLFLNRTRELAALSEAFEDVRAGASRVVLISGDRGIGKTALCDVFLRLAAAGTPLRSMRVQCREGATGLHPLRPLTDALQRFEERHLAGEAGGSGELAPAWASIRSLETPQAPVSTLVAELRALFASFARDLPLIVLLDDLQWADAATHRIVGQLARGESAGRWLVIATIGSGGASDTRAESLLRLSRAASPAVRLNLGPLTTSQVGRYLDARFGPDRLGALAAPLHDVTGGNPSMMVAAIDGLIEHGVLPADADAPAPAIDLEAVVNVLPYVLRTAMTRKLDQLDSDARALLEAASLVGIDVTASGVAAIAGTDVAHVRRVFGSLVQRGCVLRAPGEAPDVQKPDGAYRFQHPMYAHLLSERASVGQRFRATQRLARSRAGNVRSS